MFILQSPILNIKDKLVDPIRIP
ncbi:MAG: hypothetical protein HW396_1376, partial [Candidatus Dadabacteria bacterium]|nr:hypothetical protein [Candidatus Dadabacteria bacterium]